jgi:hypothetical protein
MYPDGFIKIKGGRGETGVHPAAKRPPYLVNRPLLFRSSGNRQAIIDEVFDHGGFGQG